MPIAIDQQKLTDLANATDFALTASHQAAQDQGIAIAEHARTGAALDKTSERVRLAAANANEALANERDYLDSLFAPPAGDVAGKITPDTQPAEVTPPSAG